MSTRAHFWILFSVLHLFIACTTIQARCSCVLS